MNKLQTTILTAGFVILAVSALPVFSVYAVVPPGPDLVVDFEQEPLFSEVNFFPGQFVTKWVDVTNNSSESKAVGAKATDHSSCSENCLSDQLWLEINDGGPNLYEAFLTEFFKAGEKKLSDLAAESTQRYYFKITLVSGAGNEYQDKEVNFDFGIGFFAQETIGGGGGTSGSGGYFGGDTGLIISNESASPVVGGQAEITWDTNKPATSRVIYSSQDESHIFDLNNPPNYGYAHSTDENPSLDTSHSMNIAGLEPGVTYYYRCVSRGSFAISLEHSFTMPGIKAAETGPEEEGVVQAAETEGEVSEISEEGSVDQKIAQEEIIGEESQDKGNFAEFFLASLGDLLKLDLCSMLFLLIIIVTVLLLISLENSKKEENKTKKWILTLGAIVVMIVLYGLICPYYKALLIVVGILFILFLLWYYFRKGKKAE